MARRVLCISAGRRDDRQTFLAGFRALASLAALGHLSLMVVLALLVTFLGVLVSSPGVARAQTNSLGRAWLPGEQNLYQAVALQTRGVLRPLLWPRRLPAALTGAAAVTSIRAQGGPVMGGSFLIEYRTPDSETFFRFGATQFMPPTGAAERRVPVRGLTATVVEGSAAAQGEIWIFWSELGAWRPGSGDTSPMLPAVEYLVQVRGTSLAEALLVVEALAPLEPDSAIGFPGPGTQLSRAGLSAWPHGQMMASWGFLMTGVVTNYLRNRRASGPRGGRRRRSSLGQVTVCRPTIALPGAGPARLGRPAASGTPARRVTSPLPEPHQIEW